MGLHELGKENQNWKKLNVMMICRMLKLAYPVIILCSVSFANGQSVRKDTNNPTVVDFEKMKFKKDKIAKQEPEAEAFYDQLTSKADKALSSGPFSVINKNGLPPSGNKHDYMTLAPYFWPNPETKNGLPYIRKDGEVNPETRNNYTDFVEKERFFEAVDVLGRAYFYSGDKKYADKVIQLLQAWFIEAETKMNPHLNYGQGIPGKIEGRPFGIIELGGIRNVLSTLEMLKHESALDAHTEEGVNNWLSTYLDWLQHSELGKMEATRTNNHGTTYDLQVGNIMLYLGQTDQIRHHLENITKKRIDTQIEPDGRQPHELARTKGFSYSVTNLTAFTKLASLGKNVGVDLWNYIPTDGGGIKKAYGFLIPYISKEKVWEYQQISSLEDQKQRFVQLLEFAGKEFDEDEYSALAFRYSEQ